MREKKLNLSMTECMQVKLNTKIEETVEDVMCMGDDIATMVRTRIALGSCCLTRERRRLPPCRTSHSKCRLWTRG